MINIALPYLKTVVSNDCRFFNIINMKDEKPIDYIAFCLCRGLAEYDANEIVPDKDTSRDTDRNRHSNDNED